MRNDYGSFKAYSKFRSKRCVIDGIKFASMAEGELYCLLKVTHSEIYCQPKIYLTKAKILYKPDFFCKDIFYEMKGFETDAWKLKKRLWEFYGPGPLHIYKMVKRKPELVEILSSSLLDV